MLDVDTITTIQSIVHFITDVVLCFFFTLIFYWFVFQKRERKQKCERCLAMADKCYAHSLLMYVKRNTEPVKECAMWYHRRGLWWEKWKRKWLALADKFKDAK